MKKLIIALLFGIAVSSSCDDTSERNVPEGSGEDSFARFNLPSLDQQHTRLQKSDQILNQRGDSGEDTVLRELVELAGETAVEDHLRDKAESGRAELRGTYSRLLDRLDVIRSLQEEEARSFFKATEASRNEDALAIGVFLLHSEKLQAQAANSLSRVGTSRSLKCLATRLVQASGFSKGGTEGEVLRKELRVALARAIARIAGLNVSEYGGDSEGAIEVVKEVAKRTAE